MSIDDKQLDKGTKIIGFRVTEEELQNIIYPEMHECYDLGIIDHDTLTSFLRFCVQFWMGHHRMKKHQFDMAEQDIEEEKKKLAAIMAEKEAWHRWDNSTPRVIEKPQKKSSRWERTSRGTLKGKKYNSGRRKQNSSSRRFIIKSVDLMTSFVAYLADAVNRGICRISLLTTTSRTTKVVIRRPAAALVPTATSIIILLVAPVLHDAAYAANINGTNRDDVLRGTSKPDTIRGKGGDDLIYGRAGGDNLYRGRGDDEIYGQRGNENLYGWYGNNLLDGGPGSDTIYATGDGTDNNDNTINGHGGSDRVIMRDASGVIAGGGDDTIQATGDTESSRVFARGGEGNDRISINGPAGVVRGDAGSDEIRVASVDTDHRISGGSGNDRIFDSSPFSGTIYGDAGNDYFRLSGAGDHVVRGGPAADIFVCVGTASSGNPRVIADYNEEEGDSFRGQCQPADMALLQEEAAPAINATAPTNATSPSTSGNVTGPPEQQPQPQPELEPQPEPPAPPSTDDDDDNNGRGQANSTLSVGGE
jgi:hypothetical protein